MSITALSGLAMVTGGVFSIRKKPNRSTLCWRRIMESNHHRFRNGTVFKTAWAPCPLSSVRCDARCLSSGCFNELQFITTVRAFRESRSVANSQRARLPCCRPNTLTVVAMVGGFEPPTSWLTVNRSTTELHHLRLTPSAPVDSRTCGAVSPIHRCRSQQSYRFLPLVLYVFTKRLQAKTFKYSPRVEESFHSDLIRCMESFNRCGHGAVTTMAITRRIMNPWPQRWDHWTD